MSQFSINSEESDLSIPLTSSENKSKSTEEDEEIKKYVNFKSANILSKIFFWWSRRAINLSNKGPLKLKEVSCLHPSQSTATNIVYLSKNWGYYSNQKNYTFPLIFALFKTHFCDIFILFLFEVLLMMTEFLNVYFFRQIIQHFSFSGTEAKPDFTLIQSAIFLIGCRFLRTIFFNHMDYRNMLVSERITNELTALLYEKILKANTNANQSSKEEGEKLNLIEVDAEKVGFLFFIGPKIVMGPVRVCIAIYLLFELFGFGFLYSFIILCVLLGIILILQVLYLKNYKQNLIKKDSRMKIVTHTFQILKSLKLNGWDNEFINKIKEKRDEELKYYIKNQNITVIRSLMNSNLPLIMLIVSLGVYVYSNKVLEISNLFTAFQLINQMAMPLLGIPLFLTGFFSNLISIRRLQKFLASSEHDYTPHEDMKAFQEGIMVKFDNVTFGSSVNENPTDALGDDIPQKKRTSSVNSETTTKLNSKNQTLLTDITLQINKGEFVGIIGPTGSGKSGLLNAIMNDYEVFKSNSPIIINGKISYLSQQPWVMHDTIKNNILFFNPYNMQKYEKVITCCQLKKDLNEFEKGDNSEVSTSGANVSGGQKARIALARCLYRDSDLYLLDDPLSSIDAKVGHNIFIQAFCEYLKGKTRIIATNEMNNLSLFDKIIYMEKGTIKFCGTYDEFEKSYGKDFNKLNNTKENTSEKQEKEAKSRKLSDHIQESKKKKEKKKQENEKEKKKTQKGGVSLQMYNKYIKLQGGYIIFIILIILIVCSQIARFYRELFVTSWSKSRKDFDGKEGNQNPEKEIQNYIKYIKISLMGVVTNFFIDFIISRITINCITKLHETMIFKLIKAPINLFHDIIPIGQILNRLTKDLDLVQQIIHQMLMFMRANFGLLMSIYVCYSYNPYSLILAPGLVLIGIILTNYYISSARNLHRLHRVSYSPVLTILTESIKGAETIRTAEAELHMREKIYKRLDGHFGVHLYEDGTTKWYRIILNISSHIFFGIIIGYIIAYQGIFTAQAIGLILQYATTLNEQLVGSMTLYTEIEISMVCLERCEAYTMIPGEKEGGMKTNPQNKELVDKKIKTPETIDYISWPTKGKIHFENFSARYRNETPLVIEKLTLDIYPGEKLGIVGRTGSGKSTIVLALARIIEGEEGKIEIDNYDISKIDLQTLRNNITVVPQDPFILEGTLKENIDPLHLYSDNEIIKVLDDFCLFPSIKRNSERLNFSIKENGANLSIGEKQLICFARAAMKRNKIVILDEATASIDVQTEKILQKNIDKYFNESTVIMIAHHIQMVEGCERIVVVDGGKIVECDTYKNLLENQHSKFFELYSESLAK